MDNGETQTTAPRTLMVYPLDANAAQRPDLSHTDRLLQQGLALADELDQLVNLNPPIPGSVSSPPMDEHSSLRSNAVHSSHSSEDRSLNSFTDLPEKGLEENLEENTALQHGESFSDPPSPGQPSSDQPGSQSSPIERNSTAAASLSEAAESNRAWATVWHQRGLVKLKQSNFQGACDNFERALQKRPDWVSALNGLGVAQYRLSNFARAVQIFRQAIELQPNEASLYCNLGAALYVLGDFLNAVTTFQKAARLAPREIHAYYGLGISLTQVQQHNQAIAAFRRAVMLDDQHAASYYGMGYVSYLIGELPAAIAALGKAKQRNPQYARRYEKFLKHCLEQDGLSLKN